MNLQVKRRLIDLENFDRDERLGDDQQSWDVAALWRILQARKDIVLWTIAGVMALSLVALAFIVPTYSATAVMMLDGRKNTVADVNTVLSGLPADSASVQNQIQELTSRELALKVVDKLKLDRDPEFNAELRPGLFNLFGWGIPDDSARMTIGSQSIGKDREAAVNGFLRHLNVDQVGLSTAMTVSVASTDASKSARITNALADAYIDDQLNTKFEATRKAVEWLSNRVRLMASQVQNDEAAVQKYKAENGIVDTAAGGSIVDQQTASVSVQLINAKADLAQKKALYDRVAQLQRAGRAGEVTQVVASPLIAQLRTQEADLDRQEAQLSARYLSQHPKMIDIASQKRDTRKKIAAEVARVIEGLANDVAVAQASVRSLQSSLDDLQSKFQSQNNASAKLKALQSTASASRSIYEGLLSRLKEIQGQEGIASPDVRIISQAMIPKIASPRFSSVMGIAFVASLALGLVLAFLREGLDLSLRTTDQVDRYLGLPVLTTVPEITAQSGGHGVADSVVYEPTSSFSESIRGLYLGLSLSNPEKSPKALLVTSAVPGEGKTVIAVSLARLAARNGRRVIIVDADFRRPAVARTMNIANPVGSIVDVLQGRLSLERCIVDDDRSQAVALPGGEGQVNPSDLITSHALEELITTLREKYDLVIIDSAPVLPVHDTLALSQVSDAALFVTQTGKTARDSVAAAVRSLRATKIPVAGVALTRTKSDPRYQYHDYLYGALDRAEKKNSIHQRLLAARPDVVAKLRSLVFRPDSPSA